VSGLAVQHPLVRLGILVYVGRLAPDTVLGATIRRVTPSMRSKRKFRKDQDGLLLVVL
jgi:hypothetical protein